MVAGGCRAVDGFLPTLRWAKKQQQIKKKNERKTKRRKNNNNNNSIQNETQMSPCKLTCANPNAAHGEERHHYAEKKTKRRSHWLTIFLLVFVWQSYAIFSRPYLDSLRFFLFACVCRLQIWLYFLSPAPPFYRSARRVRTVSSFSCVFPRFLCSAPRFFFLLADLKEGVDEEEGQRTKKKDRKTAVMSCTFHVRSAFCTVPYSRGFRCEFAWGVSESLCVLVEGRFPSLVSSSQLFFLFLFCVL